MSFEEHLKLFNIFQFNSFDEIESFATANLPKPSPEELKFLNQREKADPSSSFIDNLKFYTAIGKSEVLQSIILSERYGSYVSSSNFILKNLNGVKKILDIGCSIGYLTSYYGLKSPKSTFIGIDFSIESIKKANTVKKELNLKNVDFVNGDMNSIKYPNKHFELIVDTQSIYYSKDYLKTFNHLKKNLSDNGKLITVPGLGEKELIKQYIDQIQTSGLLVHDFRFIKTINLGETEYLPTITCGLKKPKEKVDTNHIINRLFDSF